MNATEMLMAVRFVVDPDGHPTAVQISIEAWNALLGWLEEADDRALVRELIPKLRAGPESSGTLNWEEIESIWQTPEAEPRP